MSKIIQITDQIQITYPDYDFWLRNRDYGSRTTDLDYKTGLQIWIADLDYGSGKWSRITDYKSGFWNKYRDKFGNDMFKMDQDLPHFYTDNFSCAIQPISSDFGQNVLWTKCYCLNQTQCWFFSWFGHVKNLWRLSKNMRLKIRITDPDYRSGL